MPPRSSVEQLSDQDREWITQALIQQNFSDYEGLARLLAERGIHISKSALHRFGQKAEERIARIHRSKELCKAIVEASPDDEGAQTEALLSLTKTNLFDLVYALGDLNAADPDDREELGNLMPRISRAIADIGRASISQKRFRDEVRKKADAAADAAEKRLKKVKGVTPETLRAIRRDIYGIVD